MFVLILMLMISTVFIGVYTIVSYHVVKEVYKEGANSCTPADNAQYLLYLLFFPAVKLGIWLHKSPTIKGEKHD